MCVARADPLPGAARGRRIVQEAQRRHRPIELFGEIVGRDAEVAGEGAMDAGAERRAGVEIGEQRLAESGQVRPCVERPERPAGEKLGIVRPEVEADIEGLLVVRPLLRIERLMHETGIAAVAADRFDRDSLLFGERQREERLRLREGRVHQIAADAVIDDIEEADVAAGRADFRGDVLERALVVAERREIDDRQRLRHVWLPFLQQQPRPLR